MVAATSELWRVVKRYWLDEETNVFRNYADALGGLVVLVALPLASLLSVFWIEDPGWLNYVFPILSICLSAAYDTYGRYCPGEKKNVKLGLRLICDALALFLAPLVCGLEHRWLAFVPPALLVLSGLVLVYEIFVRLKTAILISAWSV